MAQGRGRYIAWTLGATLALLAIGGAVWQFGGKSHQPAPSRTPTAAAPSQKSTGAGMIDALRAGDLTALTMIAERATAKPDRETEHKLTEAEAVEWLEDLDAIRGGYVMYPLEAKVQAHEIVRGVMIIFAAEGTPAGWSPILPSTYAILSAGLADSRPDVRLSALEAVTPLWGWAPGCSMLPAEETAVGKWKEGLYPAVSKQLNDPTPGVRLRAITCLAALPIDSKAAPAVACLSDKDHMVRLQVLSSFANRPTLLTEEAILPLLHDPVHDLSSLAERVLKARGLNADLIGLGRMVTDSRPEVRASIIPLLQGREDIDPAVWLLKLTEDRDDQVRLKAVQACEGRLTPEVIQRLKELSAADTSPVVRSAATKLLPPAKTVALPPLPGSPSLRMKAN